MKEGNNEGRKGDWEEGSEIFGKEGRGEEGREMVRTEGRWGRRK